MEKITIYKTKEKFRISEVARVLRIALGTARKLCDNGRIATVSRQCGSRVERIIERDAIKEFLKEEFGDMYNDEQREQIVSALDVHEVVKNEKIRRIQPPL